MDCSPPGSSVHGILQARILEWVAMPSSSGSSRPRDQTQVSFPALGGRFFTTSVTREAPALLVTLSSGVIKDEWTFILIPQSFLIIFLNFLKMMFAIWNYIIHFLAYSMSLSHQIMSSLKTGSSLIVHFYVQIIKFYLCSENNPNFTFLHWKSSSSFERHFFHLLHIWQPTPVFLAGESREWGSLVGCHLWSHTESDTTEVT